VPWWQYVLGGVYVLTIFYLPSGLMGIPRTRQRCGGAARKPGRQKQLAPAASGGYPGETGHRFAGQDMRQDVRRKPGA
jgi:hypothetical protein